MSRLLLSLWILGAVLFSANTLIILGWPIGKPSIEAGDAKYGGESTEASPGRTEPAGPLRE
jgi:hypothetical protein